MLSIFLFLTSFVYLPVTFNDTTTEPTAITVSSPVTATQPVTHTDQFTYTYELYTELDYAPMEYEVWEDYSVTITTTTGIRIGLCIHPHYECGVLSGPNNNVPFREHDYFEFEFDVLAFDQYGYLYFEYTNFGYTSKIRSCVDTLPNYDNCNNHFLSLWEYASAYDTWTLLPEQSDEISIVTRMH